MAERRRWPTLRQWREGTQVAMGALALFHGMFFADPTERVAVMSIGVTLLTVTILPRANGNGGEK